MKNEQEYIILQIQEDDYGCEERPAGTKKKKYDPAQLQHPPECNAQ